MSQSLSSKSSVLTASGPYRVSLDGSLWYCPATKKEPVLIADFMPRILAEITVDNGIGEPELWYEIESVLPHKTIRQQIPASEFEKLHWVRACGTKAIITPGPYHKERFLVAVKQLSDPEQRTLYTHLGWREGAFLHAGGALGQPDIEVQFPPELSRLNQYRLSEAPDMGTLREAVRRSLRFLEIAPYLQTIPLLAAVVTAPLGSLVSNDFAVWIYGPTGQRKSSLVALALCHYGAFSRNHLPGSFTATWNALLEMMFLAKDVCFVIDDYAPPYPKEKAEHLLRVIGDSQVRYRAKPAGGVQPEKWPRCLVIVTGEAPPPGAASTQARCVQVEWQPDSVDLEALSQAQAEDAALYPYALSGYLTWLLPQWEDYRATIGEQLRQKQNAFAAAGVQHGRIAESAAKLLMGLEAYLQFAETLEALSDQEAERLRQEAYEVLCFLGQQTHTSQIQARPGHQALKILRALLNEKRVYLADLSTGEPSSQADRWGYHREPLGKIGPDAKALKIGWVSEEKGLIYLLPQSFTQCYNDYNRRLSEQGLSVPELGQALQQEGFLAEKGVGRIGKSFRAEGRAGLKGWVLNITDLYPDVDL